MSKLRLFHFPVYAESLEKFASDRMAEVEKRVQEEKRCCLSLGIEMPDGKRDAISFQVDREWGSWDVRRVVGWIQLTLDNGELELHVYRFVGKRFNRGNRRVYELVSRREASLGTGALARWDPGDWLQTFIDAIMKTYFKSRWIERDSLHLLAKHVQWRDLMHGSLHSQPGDEAGE